MDGCFLAINPLRGPNWRQLRVIYLQSRVPVPEQPSPHDDEYVVSYYRFWLAASIKAGAQREKVFEAWPSIATAHRLYYSDDLETRQILEALLLTSESFEQIATRLGLDAAAIDLYEKLFFAVRDRFKAKAWIHKFILGTPENRRPAKDGTMTAGQRGYMYRLFAYHGGPLVLEAIVSGVGQVPMPSSSKEVPAWLDAAIANIIRSRAVIAANWLELNRKNAMQLIKLSIRLCADSSKHCSSSSSPKASEEQLQEIIAALEECKKPIDAA